MLDQRRGYYLCWEVWNVRGTRICTLSSSIKIIIINNIIIIIIIMGIIDAIVFIYRFIIIFGQVQID